MTDPNAAPEPANSKPDSSYGNEVAHPLVTPKRAVKVSWIWLVPLIAALVGLSLLVKDWMNTGPVITISFESAEGLEVGQTKLRYKNVVVGLVTGLQVAEDRSKVLVKAELNRDSADYLTHKDTRFWVVRPRLGLSGVSGLGTLVSGAYIGVDARKRTDEDDSNVYDFVGLEKPPEVSSDRPGTRFTLSTSDLGSLDIGSPVYYRRIPVGQVIGYQLSPDGRSVDVQIFVDAPNDKFVTTDARFWNSSGINLSLGAEGVSVQTGTLTSIVLGGVSFVAAGPADTTPATADSRFKLRDTKDLAMAEPDGVPFPIELQFRQSVRGLKVGAPIDFRGLELGQVIDIDLEFDSDEKYFYALVKANLYPLRFGDVYKKLIADTGDKEHPELKLVSLLVEKGLRAQVRPANLLTGQQYIALDFFPEAQTVKFDQNRIPMLVPTIAGSFDRLQQQVSSVVSKIDAIPFEGISTDLRASLKSVTQLLSRLDSQVAPQVASVLKAAQRSLGQVDRLLAQDSPMNDNLERTMRELSNAAKALRALGDYLQTNPSALIRGRAADTLPGSR
ncbi:MAG TPA: MlaD family protein [Eoetvoesiella sp.]